MLCCVLIKKNCVKYLGHYRMEWNVFPLWWFYESLLWLLFTMVSERISSISRSISAWINNFPGTIVINSRNKSLKHRKLFTFIPINAAILSFDIPEREFPKIFSSSALYCSTYKTRTRLAFNDFVEHTKSIAETIPFRQTKYIPPLPSWKARTESCRPYHSDAPAQHNKRRTTLGFRCVSVGINTYRYVCLWIFRMYWLPDKFLTDSIKTVPH